MFLFQEGTGGKVELDDVILLKAKIFQPHQKETLFESFAEAGDLVTVRELAKTFKGFVKTLLTMKYGEKCKVFLPHVTAFGIRRRSENHRLKYRLG